MMRLLIFFVVALPGLAGGSPLIAGHAAAVGGLQPSRMARTVTVETSYLLYLPEDYEQKEKWPVLLFLHGGGERGDEL
jgi:poly(3-hydroxybutyrate) depolymerase